jgi:N-acetylmuramoyl-L-alanine amidase
LKALDPNYAEIEISGLRGHLADNFALPTSLIKQVKVDATETGSVIRLWFTEPLGVEFWKSGSDFQIQLLRPGLHGTLAGKTVVIDAGHGDHDSGAQFGGIQEKNLTLAVAKKLALEMSAAGAKVIMTRTEDAFVELTDRARIANSAKADLFLSVHINSSAKVSMSGTITFYSGPNAIKELLARCIQTEIAAVSGLPGIGAWSDKRIYATKGFSVLRNTTMPGVLVELGFINHPRDRARMVMPEFQSAVAKAIVRGVRKFLGDGVKQ